MTIELLPADMSKEKWLERCTDYFEERAEMTKDMAKETADACFEQFYDDYPEDPEGAADEELSCWGD